MSTPDQLSSLLQTHFGYASFRGDQRAIMESVMAGKDVLTLMPTGGGKSLCYQLPALASEGTAIVISPLIALMKDQVDGLNLNGIPAAFINSTQSQSEQNQIIASFQKGELKLLYLSPERLLAGEGAFFDVLKSGTISLFAIDEAHCISQWGHDFRPEYLQLKSLGKVFPKTPLIALTATADQRTQQGIMDNLEMRKPTLFKSSFNRENITYLVEPKHQSREKLLDFILDRPNEVGIVYCLSRKSTEQVAAFLEVNGVKALPYHAGLSQEQREKNQNDFINDNVQVIVATIAFGMGIDKSNVRFVVHLDLPKNIEGYYQETGRAGRDGLPSTALLFFGRGDAIMLQQFINSGDPEQAVVLNNKLQEMVRFGESTQCRRKLLLEYFDESYEPPCNNCDNCLRETEYMDGTEVAQKAISAVLRLKERFGTGYTIDFLRGSKSVKIREEHKSLRTYGVGKDLSKETWRFFFQHLIDMGYLSMSSGEYPTLKVPSKGILFIKNLEKLSLPVPPVGITKDKREEQESIVHSTPDLYEKLKVWRKKESEAKGIPPYVIFSDKTLLELTSFRPLEMDDLLLINGFGEVKCQRYGEPVLAILSAYCSENNLESNLPARKKPKKEKKRKAKSNQPTPTQMQTIELFANGLSLEEIETERQLAATTLEGHIAAGIEFGMIPLDLVMKEERVVPIREAIEQTKEPGLKPIKEQLGDDFSYSEIKWVSAYLKAGQNTD